MGTITAMTMITAMSMTMVTQRRTHTAGMFIPMVWWIRPSPLPNAASGRSSGLSWHWRSPRRSRSAWPGFPAASVCSPTRFTTSATRLPQCLYGRHLRCLEENPAVAFRTVMGEWKTLRASSSCSSSPSVPSSRVTRPSSDSCIRSRSITSGQWLGHRSWVSPATRSPP